MKFSITLLSKRNPFERMPVFLYCSCMQYGGIMPIGIFQMLVKSYAGYGTYIYPRGLLY